MRPENHFPLVDSLRGVAILLVLILHFHLAYSLNHPALYWLVRNGNYGVVIFFVVSGFLITSRTLIRFGKLQNIQLRDFYAFRVARILPNILFMLVTVVSLGCMGIKIFQNNANGPSLILTIASVLTFTHNLLMEKFGYFNYCLNILWSLSVEEVFYLTFPFLCLFARRKWIPISIWVAFIFISPLYRFSHRNDADDTYGLYDYFACFDGIAIGCLAAYFRRSLILPLWLKQLTPLFFIAIALIYFSGGIWSNLVFGISDVSILTGLALLSMKPSPEQNHTSLFLRPLQWIGQRSYELYLFHIIVLALIKTWISKTEVNDLGKLFWLFVFMISSASLAAAISRFYSEPINKKLRTAFLGARSSGGVTKKAGF